jgi:hypothetical protein
VTGGDEREEDDRLVGFLVEEGERVEEDVEALVVELVAAGDAQEQRA